MQLIFSVGDRVQWVGAVPDRDDIPNPRDNVLIGVILDVIRDEPQIEVFTMYDVEFEFGRFTLYGTQLRAIDGRP